MQKSKEEIVSRKELLLWVEVGRIEVTSQFQLYKKKWSVSYLNVQEKNNFGWWAENSFNC